MDLFTYDGMTKEDISYLSSLSKASGLCHSEKD